MALTEELQRKYDDLRRAIDNLGSVAVAFSAGVDSTLLLAVTHDVLGASAVAFTATSPANPERETAESRTFCTERGIEHVVFGVNELEIEGFAHNPENRCYLCKTHLFADIAARAAQMGLACVAEGSNVDDLGDYRPGRKAIDELGVRSPLLESGLTKQDVRDLSRELGLPTWDKPSFACLYSRFAYGDLISEEKLQRIDAAEQYLRDQTFPVVRVRMMGDSARIEVDPTDIGRIVQPAVREPLVAELKRLGFAYVTLDLQGYRTGSMNETLAKAGAKSDAKVGA